MKYLFDGEEKKIFKPVNFPIDFPLQSYMDWKGYEDENLLKAAERTYGKNKYVEIILCRQH